MRHLSVEVHEYHIIIYEDASSREPFIEWLTGLDRSIRARILTRLDRVEQGNFGDHKQISEGLYELRLHFGAGYRVYFGIDEVSIILLFSGGSKASQRKDIKRAQQFWSEYKRRKSDENL
jgi:putative addiction module killer protein